MLLAVDVGNTHTVVGVFRGEELVADWRVATRKELTEDELGLLLGGLLVRAGLGPQQITGTIIASVVPDLQEALTTAVRSELGHDPIFVGPGLRTGMPVLSENPAEVGADRIVNAVAAKDVYGQPVIVLDFGTATTFDVVGKKGEYLGGVIAPGLGISAEALFERAARLHRVGIQRPERVIGRNTEQSLQSGLFHGYTGLVRELVGRIRQELGEEAPVVATGGLARVFEPELDFLLAVAPDLTLRGLRLLWERNRR